VRRERAPAGGWQFVQLPGGEFVFDADAIVTSIGQDPDLGAFAGALPQRAGLLGIDAVQATGAPGVWAGGDAASLARFVTEAVGMGKRAALAIHRNLLGDGAGDAQEGGEAVVPLAAIATWYHVDTPRAAPRTLAPEERMTGAEVQLGLDVAQALAEAERCYSCGTCISCDNCVVVCPDLAVRRVPAGGYEVLGDYCKGCGLCVRECPTGSMKMLEEVR
jgi:Pyruvate/2-oxoacid:ferredoxin oxidoreductase delta subunit